MGVLVRLVSFREYAILLLSFSALHVGANMLSLDTPAPCAYDRVGGLLMSLTVFALYTASAWAQHARSAHAQWLVHVADGAGIVPGIFFQITTKPDGWYAAVPADGCSMRESGYAASLWLLGELLTFGAAVRLATAVGFGRNVLNTAIVVASAFALQFSTALAADALNAA